MKIAMVRPPEYRISAEEPRNADCRGRRLDHCVLLSAERAADEAQRALGQLQADLAGAALGGRRRTGRARWWCSAPATASSGRGTEVARVRWRSFARSRPARRSVPSASVRVPAPGGVPRSVGSLEATVPICWAATGRASALDRRTERRMDRVRISELQSKLHRQDGLVRRRAAVPRHMRAARLEIDVIVEIGPKRTGPPREPSRRGAHPCR